MKTEKLEKLRVICLVLMFMTAISILININSLMNLNKLGKQTNEFDLQDKVKLEIDKVKEYYKYNLTLPSGFIRNEDDLIKYGGDCEDYANHYKRIFKNNAKILTFPTNDDSDIDFHAVAIISNKQGYCLIDQINYKCFLWG